MGLSVGSGLKGLAMLCVAGAAFMADTTVAFAQSQSCSRLTAQLRAIDGNRDYQDRQALTGLLRQIGQQVQQAESQYVRTGCQQAVNQGLQLNAECRAIAQQITTGRRDYQGLSRQIDEGNTMARQREAILQEIARFGCGTGSSANVRGLDAQGNPIGERRSLLDQIFGRPGQIVDDGFDILEEPRNPWSNMATLRTVCVRTCDGYFWPVSFSTVDSYLGDDANACAQQCPGSETRLFSYRNPGQDAEQMVALDGTPYRSMPYAFRYRQNYDSACSCRQRINYGTVALNQAGDQSRAVIDFGEASFPLPQRDPRRTVEAAIVADIVPASVVPLPRPRPERNAQGVLQPVETPPPADDDQRIVEFNGKRIRVVGPETPYIPRAAGAS